MLTSCIVEMFQCCPAIFVVYFRALYHQPSSLIALSLYDLTVITDLFTFMLQLYVVSPWFLRSFALCCLPVRLFTFCLLCCFPCLAACYLLASVEGVSSILPCGYCQLKLGCQVWWLVTLPTGHLTSPEVTL